MVEVEILVTARLLVVVVPRLDWILRALIDPPVTVTPLEEASPAVSAPPLKVEVALLPTRVVVLVPPIYRRSTIDCLVEEA